MRDSIKSSELESFRIQRWAEEDGFAERAEREVGETPEVRAAALKSFKEMLESQDEFVPRLDREYLLRFLRAKKYDLKKAFSLMKNYYKCRLLYPSKFAPIGVGPRDLKHLYDLNCGYILPHRNPLDGSVIVVFQFGDWTPESGYDLLDVYTPIAMAFDYVQKNPEIHINGFRFILNMLGLEFRYLKLLYPEALRAMIACSQNGYPARFRGCHIVNNSYLWNLVYGVGKPFLNEKVRSRINLHASDMTSLHEHISPEILPTDFKGKAGDIKHHWFTDEMYETHDDFVDNSHYGYQVDKDGNWLKEIS